MSDACSKFVSNVPSMMASLCLFLAVYTVVLWAIYKYYGARVLLNHIARQFNLQQRQQQLRGFDDEADGNGGAIGGGVELEMVNNAGQQVEEAAAGMAIQAIEQVLSGNVTPNFGSPINSGKKALNQQLLQGQNQFLSPNINRYHIESDDDDDYDGSTLMSPATRQQKPFKLTLTLPKKNPTDVSILG